MSTKFFKGIIQAKEALTGTSVPEKRQAAFQMIMGALAILTNPQKMRAVIQAAGVSSDFEPLNRGNHVIDVNRDNWDNGWEAAFKRVNVSPGQLFWTIYDVYDSFTFEKIEEGGRLKSQEWKGEKQVVFCDYYGAAVEFTDRLIRTNDIAAMANIMTDFFQAWGRDKGNIFYNLIAAAAAIEGYTPLQGSGGTLVQRVITTINLVADSLGKANKDKALGDTANIPMIMYCSPTDEALIESAFSVTNNALVSAGETGVPMTRRRIQRIYTYNQFILPGHFIMAIPGGKTQMGMVMDLTAYEIPRDPKTLNKGMAAWSILGGAVADTEQFKGGQLEDAA